MTKSVRLDPLAEEELAAAEAWYEEQAGLGHELVQAVRAAGRRISGNPSAFPLAAGIAPARGIRRCLIERFPYALFFIELDDEIRVLAVAHQRRKPLHWRRRG
jgi:plasmid stabilization system protein ParE